MILIRNQPFLTIYANSNVPMYNQTITTGLVQIANADASNDKTIYTAGAQGSCVESLNVASTDTADRDIQLSIKNSSTVYPLGVVKIPLTSGTVDNVPAVDILRNAQIPGLPYDAFGNRIIYLKSGDTLVARALTTVTSGKLITLVALGGDF